MVTLGQQSALQLASHEWTGALDPGAFGADSARHADHVAAVTAGTRCYRRSRHLVSRHHGFATRSASV
jgi:hypothetical protein